jgi:hypothetical protein
MSVMRSAVALFVLTIGSTALAAPTKEECVDANARGQVSRKQGALHAARTSFQTCSDSACPSVVRRDCETRLADVEKAIPSVSFDATEGGQKITNATVTADGAPFGSTDGTSHEIDPGAHRFVFRRQGRPDVVREIAVDEGAHGQRVAAVFDEPQAASANLTYRNVGIALSAVGLGGIIVGAVFGGATFASWGSVKGECPNASACDYTRATSDRSQAMSFSVVSDVGFIVGGALVAAGAVFLVLGARVVPVANPRVIGLSIVEEF